MGGRAFRVDASFQKSTIARFAIIAKEEIERCYYYTTRVSFLERIEKSVSLGLITPAGNRESLTKV